MLVDSHCHLNLIDYQELGADLPSTVQAANDNGVEHMLCVGTNLIENAEVIRIAELYDTVSATVGLHPNEIVEKEPSLDYFLSLALHPKVIGIGETGLDYYRSEGDLEWQKTRFRLHIEVAKRCKKPLIIHTRQARADTIEILKKEQADEVQGVMHCFTEDWETARQALDLGFYISFSGIVTFKNAIDLQTVAKKVPLDRMLIETDAPFLAPIPFRGKINQPAYVKHVAEFLANLRGIPFELLAKETTKNFYTLFKR